MAIYDNADINKVSILKGNIGKSGIYRWVNKINNKTYIGSATDLSTRFYVFYNVKRLMDSKMPIYRAILKYGYSNFILEILEYCDKNETLIREQYYIDNLKPEYNIYSKANSSAGYKHSQDTLDKFKLRIVSNKTQANSSKLTPNHVLSEEAKKMFLARAGTIQSDIKHVKLSAITKGIAVIITNIKTSKTKEYLTLTDAALALDVSRTTIKNNLKSGKILKDKYTIKFKNKK